MDRSNRKQMSTYTVTTNQLSAIARLFSSGVIRELSRKGKSPFFARLAAESSLFDELGPYAKVGHLFDRAFSILRRKAHRHEYVYKAALTQKILLGAHSLHTASMLTEFRIGDCKADLAILNGTGTVYEIKSERDSLSRLTRQVTAYKGVFAKVYVIAGENHVSDVFDVVAPEVGVMQLSARHQISILREALDQPERTNPMAIFDSIRLAEAKEILRRLGMPIPLVPNTEMHSELRSRFGSLDPAQIHAEMVRVLKKTRNLQPLSNLVDRLPASLQTAALTAPLRKADHERLVKSVSIKLSDAQNWA